MIFLLNLIYIICYLLDELHKHRNRVIDRLKWELKIVDLLIHTISNLKESNYGSN